jgi:hypothetical protein
LFFPERFQPFRGTETFISLSLFQQLLRITLIEGEALGLTIGTILSPPIRTFFPADPQPFKIFEDMVDGGIGRSLHIRIFNSKDENSVVMLCKKVIEKSGSGIPDVEETGGGGSEADAHIGNH